LSFDYGSFGVLNEWDWLVLTPRILLYDANGSHLGYREAELGLEYGTPIAALRSLGEFSTYLWASGSRREYLGAYEGYALQRDWHFAMMATLAYTSSLIPQLTTELRYELDGTRSNFGSESYDAHSVGLYFTFEPAP